jgi:hypothetical protein
MVVAFYFVATTLFQSEPSSVLFFSDTAAKTKATIKIKNNIAHFLIIWLFEIVPSFLDMPNIDNKKAHI